MKRALVGSVGLNAALAVLAAYGARHRIARLVRRRQGRWTAPRAAFADIAQERFTGWSAPQVALIGDSQFELAPVPDLVGAPVRSRAISGAMVQDVLLWVDDVLAGRPEQVVLFIGSNDAFFRVPHEVTAAAAQDLFGRLAEGGCAVRVVMVPPLVGRDDEVERVNGELTRLSALHGFGTIDLHGALSGTDWTSDGLHLTASAYQVLGDLLALH